MNKIDHLKNRMEHMKRERKAWSYFEQITFSRLQRHRETVVDSCDENLEELLNLLGLKSFYPRKISITSVTEINFDFLKEPRDWKDVPWWTLKRIILSDISYREVIPRDNKKSKQAFNVFDDEQTENTNVKTSDDRVIHPHPADVFCAIFLCCNDFLKEVLFRKMAKLQVALPLTFTISSKTSFFKWPLNRVFLAEECESVVNAEYQTILFLRLGNVSFPKSRVINEILRKQKHETFLHKKTKNRLKSRIISKGCIEISWYIHVKEEEEEEKFSENLAFLNLRGDGLTCKSEAKIVLPLCSVVILFMEYRNIHDFFLDVDILSEIGKTDAKLVVITNFPKGLNASQIKKTMRSIAEKANKGKEKFDCVSVYDTENQCKLENEEIGLIIAEKLKTCLAFPRKRKALKEICTKRYPGVDLDVDEDRVKKQADVKILEFMTSIESCSKSEVLPLQGRSLWKEYSKLLKEKKRLHKASCEDYNDENSKNMSKIRENQIRLCNKSGHVVAKFVEILLQNEMDKENLLLFTSWIRYELDTISRQKYQKSKIMPNDGENLIQTAIGLEHFFREMGQIFEAFNHFPEENISSKTLSVLNRMPKVVAKLLLLGTPIEIMDGDAGNIPLKWIRAVFNEIQNELPEKKLLSLSVIGIQSSGKSTMLNTMFGVEFAVSCGRCTRGIFMQLIPVHKSDDFSPQYDYLMLFDTEGLRSVEEGDNVFHDNELATMVVGVADVVVINIKGETIAEMENVLQIVVYALLRVRQVYRSLNLKPSCIFLHQNAEKGEALKEQMLKITRNLDKVTKTIADRECIRDVEAFKDVIDFNPEDSVKYISNLWLGRPPMAPLSESYSRDIMNVGTHILRNMTTKILHCLSVEDSMEKIQNTWEAILAEDFVFSFRNTLEVKAYNSLDSQVKIVLFEIEHLKNKLSLEIDPAFCRCDLTDIDKIFSNFEVYFEKTLNEGKDDGLRKISEFIEKSELKSHIKHWEKSKEITITEKTETMKRELRVTLNVRLERRKLKLVNNDEYIWRQMFNAALDLAKGLKNIRLPEDQKLKKFEELWTKKVKELVPKTDESEITRKHEKLWNDMVIRLNTEFNDHTNLINSAVDKAVKLCYSYETFTECFKQLEIKPEDYKKNKTYWEKICSFMTFPTSKQKERKKNEKQELENEALSTLYEFCREVDLEFEKFTQDCEYDVTSFTPLLAMVRKKFKDVSNAPSDKIKIFEFTHECETKFASALSFYVYNCFRVFNEDYEKANSVRTWIESKKDRARQIFIDTIQKREDLDIAVNEFSREVRDLICLRIKKSLPLKMKEHAERKVSCKYQILVDYLIELAEKENFNDYKLMLNNPYCAAKNKFLEQAIESFKGSGDNSPLNRHIAFEINQDIEEIVKLLDEIDHGNKSITDWIKYIADNMQRLEFKHGYEYEYQRFTVSDFKEFKTSLNEGLEKTQQELIVILKTIKSVELKLAKSEILKTFDEIWGCPELCPFCKEPCQFDKDHIKNQPHRCIQHRPIGLTGWRNSASHEMVVKHCNWNVNSFNTAQCGEWCSCKVQGCEKAHPYQKYKDFIPDWDIPPFSDLSGSPYWAWVVVRFLDDLIDHYHAEIPDIPDEWLLISKQKAIESIKKYVPKSDKK